MIRNHMYFRLYLLRFVPTESTLDFAGRNHDHIANHRYLIA